MGLQKYRADVAGPIQHNGGIPYYTRWVGGPTLALIKQCPIVGRKDPISPRTVYITGEPQSWFNLPAACRYKRTVIRGYIVAEKGEYIFQAAEQTKI